MDGAEFQPVGMQRRTGADFLDGLTQLGDGIAFRRIESVISGECGDAGHAESQLRVQGSAIDQLFQVGSLPVVLHLLPLFLPSRDQVVEIVVVVGYARPADTVADGLPHERIAVEGRAEHRADGFHVVIAQGLHVLERGRNLRFAELRVVVGHGLLQPGLVERTDAMAEDRLRRYVAFGGAGHNQQGVGGRISPGAEQSEVGIADAAVAELAPAALQLRERHFAAVELF